MSVTPQLLIVNANPDVWVRLSKRLRARLHLNVDGSVTWLVERWRRNLNGRVVSASPCPERVYRSFVHGPTCTCRTISPSPEPCEHIRGLERAGLLIVLSLHAVSQVDPVPAPIRGGSSEAKPERSAPTPADWQEYHHDGQLEALRDSVRKLQDNLV
jgi:hypothetical protein